MSLSLKKQFEVRLTGCTTTLCGQDYEHNGRRQLVPCPEGEITGPDFHGDIMPAGIDHQLVRSDGVAEIEVYDESLKWMTEKIFVCDGTRLPDAVLLTYYTVEQVNDHPALG